MTTLLAQIEACLNSRPLVPLTGEPDQVLTPFHFLIGSSSTAIPEPSLVDEHISPNHQFLRIQKMRDVFWQNWSAEYLQSLQRRQKWNTVADSISVGDLVLIKNEFTPPTRWPLAKVTEVHPGKDDLIRVVTLMTAKGTL